MDQTHHHHQAFHNETHHHLHHLHRYPTHLIGRGEERKGIVQWVASFYSFIVKFANLIRAFVKYENFPQKKKTQFVHKKYNFCAQSKISQCNWNFSPQATLATLLPAPNSYGAYFEKRRSSYKETLGVISMAEKIFGTHLSCLRSSLIVFMSSISLNQSSLRSQELKFGPSIHQPGAPGS